MHKFFYIIFICLAGCKSPQAMTTKEYLKYLSDPKNGLVKEKSIAGIKYKIKYLPTEYLRYTATKSNAKNEKSSSKDAYANSLTFLVNIGPAKGENFDITRVGVSSYDEFAARIEKMAFGAQEWMSIRSGEKEFKPSIVRMENINAQDNSRNFIVVFTARSNKGDIRENDLCFSYQDELFNTGVNKFVFKSEDINGVPEFKF